MRVLVDANPFVSFLLHPARDSAASRLVRAAIAGEFTLLVPEGLLEELVRAGSEKPYLARRIPASELAELTGLLREVAEAVPFVEPPFPAITRDPKDDYLIAYAVTGFADYLVTGDGDLLALGRIDNVRILTAGALLARLEPGE